MGRFVSMKGPLLLGEYPSGLEQRNTGESHPAMPEPRSEDRPIEPDPAGGAAAVRPADRLVIWGVSAAVIGVFLVVDLITPYAIEMGPVELIFVLVGICVGQADLIATWAVLSRGNLVVRLPWAILLAMAMWYALVLAGRAAHVTAIDDAVVLGVVLLAGVTIAQAPLWIAKRVFRWRLVLGADGPVEVETGPWQFTLQHLLLATFLLAVALAPLRKVLPPGPIGHVPFDRDLLVIVPAVIVCNLLVTVPCIWGALVLRTAVVPLAIGWLFYCVFLTGAELVVILAMGGRHASPPSAFMSLLVVNVGQCATVFGTLLIYRALGFRLVRARPPDAQELRHNKLTAFKER